MARYGIDFYGLVPYGSDTTALLEFEASPFIARPINYGVIQLTWTSPAGDWSRIRLIRNTYGFPLSVDDGVIVYDEPKNFDSGIYTDDGSIPNGIGLKQGRAYHYSLFVLGTQTNVWVKAGDAAGISIKNFNTFDYMYGNLPAIYKTTNLNAVTDAGENPDLQDFLRVFAVTYDLLKTNAELVLNTYDPSIAYFPIIPVMMQQFGVAYEPEIGLQQSRILLRNAVRINKLKGSRLGVTNFIKAFTGYDEVTTLSRNIMLDYNDSSFEESIGRWESIARATLSRVEDDVVTPYSEPTLPSDFPNKTEGALRVICGSGGDAEFACGLSAPKTRGVPVEEGGVYTFSMYSRAASTTRKIYLDIRWFDLNGAEISRAGETNWTNTAGGWTRGSVTGTAPVNCFFMIPTVRIEGSADTEVHYFDAAQMEESSEGPTAFEEARELRIILKATRVNELTNPSFEVEVDPWSAVGGNISRDLLISDDANGSDVSLLIEATSDNEVEIKYDSFIDVLPLFWYSVSAHFRTGFTGDISEDYQGVWKISWYDANQVLLSETVGPANNLTEFYSVDQYTRIENVLTVFTTETNTLEVGQQVRLLGFEDLTLNGEYTITVVSGRFFQVTSVGDDVPTTNGTTSTFVQDLALKFSRTSFSALSPEGAEYAKTSFIWENPIIGEELRMDTAMFERSTIAKPYFDGSTGFSSAADLIWEDGVHTSRSHYYKNRIANQLRLVEKLPEYVVYGTPFSLFLAQPETSD